MNLETLEREIMTIMNKYEAAGYLSALVINRSSWGTKFFDGEGIYYANLFKKVAEALLTVNLPDTTEFEVGTDGDVKLRYAGKELPLFSVLKDTYRGRPRDCEKYCDTEYQRFVGALYVCVALKKEGPSQDDG